MNCKKLMFWLCTEHLLSTVSVEFGSAFADIKTYPGNYCKRTAKSIANNIAVLLFTKYCYCNTLY